MVTIIFFLLFFEVFEFYFTVYYYILFLFFILVQIWNVRNRCNLYFRFVPRIMDGGFANRFIISVYGRGGYLSIINLFRGIIVSSGINDQHGIIKLINTRRIVCATTIDGNQRRIRLVTDCIE